MSPVDWAPAAVLRVIMATRASSPRARFLRTDTMENLLSSGSRSELGVGSAGPHRRALHGGKLKAPGQGFPSYPRAGGLRTNICIPEFQSSLVPGIQSVRHGERF